MSYNYDDSVVSDLHKDAYGIRPTQRFWHSWDQYSADEKQAEWDWLIGKAEERARLERDLAQALEIFEARVTESIAAGAKDRNQAIKWILQSEGLDKVRDPGYVCYQLGLSYDHEGMFALFCGD
jgi:hypothetical protein